MAHQNKQNRLGSQKHEWKDKHADGRNITYRAIHHGTEWRVIWSYKVGRSEEVVWEEVESVTFDMWEILRDILWRKYQRRRIPYELVEAIDKRLASFNSGEKSEDSSQD